VTDKTEIFRHLRPQFFDRKSAQLMSGTEGGVSFMLKPSADKLYNYWIYICPKDVQFSAKQSVKSLRDTSVKGIVPWGTIELDGTPVLDQLIASVLASKHHLPTEVNAYIRTILMFNNLSEAKLTEFKVAAGLTKYTYETN
jgi:hypothetical protein